MKSLDGIQKTTAENPVVLEPKADTVSIPQTFNIVKGFDCVCMRCKKHYYSPDEVIDVYGFGKCGECKKITAEIARKVDEQIAERRRREGYIPPQKNPLIEHKGWINSRDLMGF